MSMENALNRIRREAGIKKCLIVDGNVNDVVLFDRKIMNVKDAIRSILTELGYLAVVSWDRISGVDGDIGTLKATEDVGDESGEEYDIGEEIVPEQTLAPGSCKTPCDMLNVVCRTMTDRNQRVAFILDWSEYLFSSNGMLDADDREHLTLLGKAIRTLEPRFGTKNVRGSTVVIIASKSSYIPIPAYSGNPEVSIITVSKPSLEERRLMMVKVKTGFKLKDDNAELSNVYAFENCVNLLNDFTNREIIQMANLSQTEQGMSFEKLFYLFRYGEKENPWEMLNIKKVRTLRAVLSERVIGQDRAIEHVEDTIIKAYMGMTGIHKSSSKSMPKGVFFLVGPTGVGKTELSKALAKFLFGDESACIRFDMSEYTQPNSDQKLIGAPPGYVGYESGGQLTNAIREKPFSVVLFDEIEKAAKPNPRILDIFLQILEDGRLTDGRGETTYFTDTVIIFTSNLGASSVRDVGNNDKTCSQFVSIVKDYFDNELGRPEILGRIGYDNIIPFNFINDRSFAKNILLSKFKPIDDSVYDKYGLHLKLSDESEFSDYILAGADVSKGGRDILNALDTRLITPLAKFLFPIKEELDRMKDSTIIVTVSGGKLGFRFDE